jgi:hypothetical protein
MKGSKEMVVAIYKSNCKSVPEEIRVHKYASDNKLRIESVSNFRALEIGEVYENLQEVEKYLENRDKVFGYSLIISL